MLFRSQTRGQDGTDLALPEHRELPEPAHAGRLHLLQVHLGGRGGVDHHVRAQALRLRGDLALFFGGVHGHFEQPRHRVRRPHQPPLQGAVRHEDLPEDRRRERRGRHR